MINSFHRVGAGIFAMAFACYLLANGPHKARQLPRHRSDRLISRLAARQQSHLTLVQSLLRFPAKFFVTVPADWHCADAMSGSLPVGDDNVELIRLVNGVHDDCHTC